LYFNSVYINYSHFDLIDSEFLHSWIKNIPFVFTVLGAGLSLFLINCFNMDKKYIMELKLQPWFKPFYIFLNKKWHFDQLVNELIVVKTMNFGYKSSFQTFDKGLIEWFGSTGLTFSVFSVSSNFVTYSSGMIFNAIFIFICFILMYITFFAFNFYSMFSVIGFNFVLLFVSYLLFVIINPFTITELE
jgi:hypothetical protein